MNNNYSYITTKELLKNVLKSQGYTITNEKDNSIDFKDLLYAYHLKLEQYPIDEDSPYINGKYNPNYGDNRLCECGHSYVRHFDPYEDMEPCGCKYCSCYRFKESKYQIGQKIEFTQEGMPPLLHGRIIEVNHSYITVKCKNGCRRFVNKEKIIRIMPSR